MTQAVGELMYGTVVAFCDPGGDPGGEWGVVLRGKSGSGKSDLALRLIEAGAVLVADDQIHLSRGDGLVYASAPRIIAGLLEVRGVGVVPMVYRPRVPLALIINLVGQGEVPRLPDARTEAILGLELPMLDLYPFEASAPHKVKVALRSLLG